MLRFISSLPEQLEKSAELKPPLIEGGPFSKILFVGMGGSAIPGDIIRSLFWSKPFSIEVLRDYSLPGQVDEETLIVFVSYSGDTEETLSCLEEAFKLGLRTSAITSGGSLRKEAEKRGIPLILVPEGFPPRGALGWLLGSSLKVLSGTGLIEDREVTKWLKGAAKFLSKEIPEMEDLDSDARDLAEKFYLRIPLIYASQRFFPIAYRWETEINENAKAFAHSHSLSEMNHNEIAGLKNPQEKIETMWAVFLEMKEDHKRIAERIQYTIELVRDSILGYSIVKAKGRNTLERVLYLVLFGDFVSFFLAQAYAEDTLAIPRIEMLKEKLKE